MRHHKVERKECRFTTRDGSTFVFEADAALTYARPNTVTYVRCRGLNGEACYHEMVANELPDQKCVHAMEAKQ